MSEVTTYKINGRLSPKFLTLLLPLIVTSLLITPQTAHLQTISNLASDPQGGMGFNRAHWATSINKMIVPFGTSGSGARGDNSVRAFDPVTNKWEYLWPNSNGASGLQNRDNHASFYVPRLDEFWIWGGSHLEALPSGTALVSGRFSISQKKWIETNTSIYGAFSNVVENFAGFLIDPANAWSEQADMGLMFGGSEQGNPQNRYWIIEPNLARTKPYKMAEVKSGVRPPPRDQAHNLLVAAGTDFYLLSGHKGQWTFTNDFWKFDGIKRLWTELKPPPSSAYASAVTYDSDRKAVVAWVWDKLYVYDIATSQWSDQSPPGLPCVFNQVGVYAPNAKMHVFSGGNKCDSTGSSLTYGVRLSSLSPAARPLTPPRPTPAPVPPPSLQAPAATRTQIAPEASTPTSTPKRVSQLDIPLRTWVARAYNTPNAPASTHAGSGYGSKHLRAAQDFQNGKVYFAGGDYYSSVSPWFGIWSYDPITNKWEMEHSYCGSPGNIMPPGLDEVGWVWDSKRNLFWMLPGYTVSRRENPNLPQCVGGATEVGGILTFDPATKKWANPGIPVEPVGSPPGSAQRAKNAIYDPVTDSIYRSSVDHRGFIWTVLNLSTKSWNVYQTVAATDRTYINNVDLGFEQLAADIAGRKIYAIDPFFYRLLAFDIDSKTISIKAPIPVLDPQRVAQARATVARPHIWQDFTMPVFDSVNRKLLFPYIDSLDTARPKLLIYDPETNSWETDKMHQPEGREVRGNTALFLPVHNAMMILGGLAPGGDADPTVTHFFLYRYGPGSGQSPIREK